MKSSQQVWPHPCLPGAAGLLLHPGGSSTSAGLAVVPLGGGSEQRNWSLPPPDHRLAYAETPLPIVGDAPEPCRCRRSCPWVA